MQETWVLSLRREDSLEKGKATHSSILAWTVPWTEQPGGLQSMGWQRVGHDWRLALSYFPILSLRTVWKGSGLWSEETVLALYSSNPLPLLCLNSSNKMSFFVSLFFPFSAGGYSSFQCTSLCSTYYIFIFLLKYFIWRNMKINCFYHMTMKY